MTEIFCFDGVVEVKVEEKPKKEYACKKEKNTEYVNKWRSNPKNREHWNEYMRARQAKLKEKKLYERKLRELDILSA